MYSYRSSRRVLNILNALENRRHYIKGKNPISKTIEIIANDLPFLGNKKKILTEHADIVIIGGGFIGSSVAHSLKARAGVGLSVVVLEKDFTCNEVENNMSLGTFTQHFSLPENIELSKYGAEFLRNIKGHLGDVDIQYQPYSNLILACDKYSTKLEENVALQAEYGLKSELLTTAEINNRYPWLNTHDIKLGCLGAENEGVFNASSFLNGLIYKSQELGATYVNAEVIGFELVAQRDLLMEGVKPGSFQKLNRVIYRTPDNEEHAIKFAICVLAAGDQSATIAEFAKIGVGDELLSCPLPIQKRSSKVYSIRDIAKETGLYTPMITDSSGLWLRRNGFESNLVCSHIPLINDQTKELTDEEYFLNVVKPSLLNRIANSENVEITELGTEMQDCSTYDFSGFIGPHPYHNNLYLAAGFGRQGCIHAPGIGRAITELIIDSRYITIDLSRFHFDRLLTSDPIVEMNIY